jgi:hypothetical protein
VSLPRPGGRFSRQNSQKVAESRLQRGGKGAKKGGKDAKKSGKVAPVFSLIKGL